VPIIHVFIWTSLLVLLAASGCARTAPAPLEAQPPEELAPIRYLVVLPTALPAPDGQDVDVDALQEGAQVIDRLLADFFLEHQQWVIVATQEQQEAMAIEFPGNRLEMARQIGQRLNGDAVLQVMMERYFERLGTNYSVQSPASVAFRFRLIHVASGRIICTGMFNEAQQPLTSDLFAFPKMARRGFKWVTAEELTEEGLQRELRKCEPLRPLLPGKRLLDKNNPKSL
jgi:hypothetical protein